MNNHAFFRKIQKGSLSLGDIFSDVGKKHSGRDTAKVLISGTELTTPTEADMLSTWQKPFLFARFFLGYLVFLLLCWALGYFIAPTGYYLLMLGLPFLMPMTLLLLVWEMNIPRNISLMELLKIITIGGILSIIAALILFEFDTTDMVIFAGLFEEPAKLLVICLILKKKNYKYSINGLLIGVAVGTGFAVIETLLYVVNSNVFGLLQGFCDALNGGSDINSAAAMAEEAGIREGLTTAILRALVALSGHGVYAGLYGYALVKVKGADKLQFKHLFRPEFLLYFFTSILFHALHNSGISLGLPIILNFLPSEYLIIGAIGVILLLRVMGPAVNQAVDYAKSHHQGRITIALAQHREPVLCLQGAGGSYPLAEGCSLTIGRSPTNHIPLPDSKNVSNCHCRVQLARGIVTVTDLGSTNGTYINRKKLVPHQPQVLGSGDTLLVGHPALVFRLQKEATV